MTPPLRWVQEARVLMTRADATVSELAAWLGDGVVVEGGGLKAGPDAIPGAGSVTVIGRDGVPDSLAAWYPDSSGPTLEEAEAALGQAEELPRLAASPPQLAFPRYHGEAATCFVGATTWDPRSVGGARRLFQLTLRRDPLGRALL
jgi:hypothetical protein